MKVHRQRSGRSADESQREHARRLVEMYEKAKASPSGRYCVNPNDAEEERGYLDYSDPSLLISALKTYVAHGTFTDPLADGVKDMILRDQFQKLRAGSSHQGAIAQLAQEHNIGERTIERRLSTTKRDRECR